MDNRWRYVDDTPEPERRKPTPVPAAEGQEAAAVPATDAPEPGAAPAAEGPKPGSAFPPGDVDRAWLRLQVLHTPIRSSIPREQAALTAALRDLERIFLANEGLGAYYSECLRPEAELPAPGAAPPAPLTPTPHIDYVARLQVLLMQDAFYTLSLIQYANALDNRGWVNLFRRWGRSPTFNRRLDELRATLNLDFLEFYDLYLRYMPRRIDDDPVPHPWDPEAQRIDPRTGEFGIPRRTGGEPDPRTARAAAGARDDARDTQPEAHLLPGIYLDPGLREVKPTGPNPGERPVGNPVDTARTAG